MKRDKHPSEYLNDLQDWQEHQYDPGHFLGGNLPPQTKYATRGGKTLGIILSMLGVISLVSVIGSMFFGAGSSAFFGLGYSALLLIAGVSLLARHRRGKSSGKH